MANIFRELSREQGLFRDEKVFLPDYLPDELLHREKEIKEIAFALKNAGEGKRPENIVLIGPSGTGKTSCAKFVSKQLAEYARGALPIYVNCWEKPTRYGILNHIITSLGEMMPRRGYAVDEISDKMVEVIRREKRIPIIILDEFDRLFATDSDEQKILYDLGRANENFSLSIGIIAITNHKDVLIKLEPRVRSSLVQRSLEFQKYTPQQLKDILNERAKNGFVSGVLDSEVVPLCAAIAGKNNGDCRLAINTLWLAGKEAEREGAKKVLISHVKSVQQKAQERNEERLEGRLTELDQEILDAIRDAGGALTSGELYAKLKKEERTIRLHLPELERLGFIKIEESREGQGRTRLIRLVKK